MILWVDGLHDPAENMRRDQRLLAAAETGQEPVLRLFGFAPHGITLGMSQIPERELNLERCVASGIPWAVRPTGGRAIFHAEEWTYSLAAPLADPEWGGPRAAAYERVSRWLITALQRLGVPAELAPGSARDVFGPRAGGNASDPCFASSARHEVVVQGRKLVGSAQRRTAYGLLQQGSLLLGDGHLRLADFLAVPDAQRTSLRERLRLSTADAGRWLGAQAPLERWGDALSATWEPGVRRFEAAAGSFLLTLSKPHSYTSANS